jgi:hypothetical protein
MRPLAFAQPLHLLFRDTALHTAVLAGDIGNFCDHVEHNEPASRDLVCAAAASLRQMSAGLARSCGTDIVRLYEARLNQIQMRNVLFSSDRRLSTAGGLGSLRDLQLLQADHDRLYHPDVFGLSKYEQLRHYAFHVSKLAAALAKASDPADEAALWDVCTYRVADMFLFGLKLSTVMHERLPDDPVETILPRP